MAAAPRRLLFDLDGVLAHYDRGLRCRELSRRCGVDPVRLDEAMFGERGLEHASDRGDIGLEEYLRRLRELHGLDVAREHFLEARRLSTQADAGMAALCSALAPQVELAVFTNNGEWLADNASLLLPTLAPLLGPRWMTSGRLRAQKPDPSAFQACLQALGWPAEGTLFVDDRAENVAGAQAAGLAAICFEGEGALRAHLHTLGLATGANDAD